MLSAVIGPRYISPTQAARAAQCMHAWHLECHGDPEQRVAPDAGALRLIAAGEAWERECFESVDGAVKVEWNEKDWAAGHATTEALMREGAPWIYQPVLVRDDVRGRPDFLRRVRGRSRLGRYTYEPVDVKSHQEVTAKDRVQLCVSARLLQAILGHAPRRGGIWLSTGRIAPVRLDDTDDLLDEMRRVRDESAPTEAVRCSECGTCPWVEHCWRAWEAARHSTLIYGVTGATARKLISAGLRTVDDVALVAPARLARKIGVPRDKAARFQRAARAWATGRPIAVRRPRWPDTPAVHFYDVETLGETVYLHGLVTLKHGATEERQAFVRAVDDERRAWHEFLDVVAVLPEGPIYSWTNYERRFARALWSRHHGSARGYRRLTRDLVDLCALVRDHYALPASSYSLKEVAPLFGFAWQAEDAGGLAAGAWYEEWLARPDDDALLRRICEYNLDDVRAMAVVYRGLLGVS